MQSMLTLFVVLALLFQDAIGGKVSVYRYWLNGRNHFYTTNAAEIGTTTPGQTGNYGYVSEGIGFKLENSQKSGSVPLYRYYQGTHVNHFYTTNAAEIGTTTPGQTGNYGYVSEGILGYCFPTQCAGTVPLYRYYNGGAVDHFYTTNYAELGGGAAGWAYEGIQCYVYSASSQEIVPIPFADGISDKSGFIESIGNNSSIYYMMYIIIALLFVNIVCFGMSNYKGRGNVFKNKYKVVNYDSESNV